MATQKSFTYTAMNHQGQIVRGELQAASLKAARYQLQQQALLNIKIKPVKVSVFALLKKQAHRQCTGVLLCTPVCDDDFSGHSDH